MGVYAAANEREIGQAETRKRKGDEQFIVGLSIQNKKIDIHAHRADKCKGNIPYFPWDETRNVNPTNFKKHSSFLAHSSAETH